MDNTKDYEKLNDPAIYPPGVPYLLYDENGETIISRTAKGINEGRITPYEIDMKEVTLFQIPFIKQLLEEIDAEYIMDVAEAIDDENDRQVKEDVWNVDITSFYYGTGRHSDRYYSWSRRLYGNDYSPVNAKEIAERISNKRNKAEAFKKKADQRKHEKKLEEARKAFQDLEKFQEQGRVAHIITPWIAQSIGAPKEKPVEQDNAAQKEIAALKKEIEKKDSENKKLLKENSDLKQQLENKEPEQAFNAYGKKCFTKAQMGVLLYALGWYTEEQAPVKVNLVPIISAIGGWEEVPVNSTMKKAKFSKEDIDKVFDLFKDVMPKFAKVIREKLPSREPK